MWQRARSTSKTGFDKIWGWADKLGAPVNDLSHKLGSEAFWPTSMDKECEKAARILRSFCKDGFVERDDESRRSLESTRTEGSQNGSTGVPRKNHSKILKRIPQDVIRNAKGLAIFTTMRTGLWVSGAGGSGVLIARLPDGSWSCPSGIMLHTAGVGFLVGVDIYDCVMVLNTTEAIKAFSKIRCTVGGELSAVAGPIGMGGVLDSEVHKRQAPLFTYLKSRGFYAGVQLDGTIIIERSDENERFYGRRVSVEDILAGRISSPPKESDRLIQTVKMAQGDTDVDVSMLTIEAPPSDFDIASGQVFGVPGREDPDPYGFHALEKEGLVVREAGTRKAASRESFLFMPSPSSPLFGAFSQGQGWDRRASLDESKRSSWRTSFTEKSAQILETSTTNLSESTATSSRPQSGSYVASMAGIPEMESIDQKLKEVEPEKSTEMNLTEEIDGSGLPTQIESVPSSPKSGPQKLFSNPPALPPREFPGPILPPRPQTTSHRILQEQLAMAGQLRELISPTPPPGTASPVEEASKGEPISLPFSDAVDISPLCVEQVSDEPVDHVSLPGAGHNDQDKQTTETQVDPPVMSETECTPDLTHTALTSDVDDGADADADADDEDSDFSDEDDVVFHEVITTAAPRIVNASPQFISKARLVNVTLPSTPALPSRNPNRMRMAKSHVDLRPESNTVEHDQRSLHDEPRPSSRASSVYSAKEEVLSSTRGSESLASLSSNDNLETSQFPPIVLANPPSLALKT
jgi:lipid-binding SYLF domain-containing protein